MKLSYLINKVSDSLGDKSNSTYPIDLVIEALNNASFSTSMQTKHILGIAYANIDERGAFLLPEDAITVKRAVYLKEKTILKLASTFDCISPSHNPTHLIFGMSAHRRIVFVYPIPEARGSIEYLLNGGENGYGAFYGNAYDMYVAENTTQYGTFFPEREYDVELCYSRYPLFKKEDMDIDVQQDIDPFFFDLIVLYARHILLQKYQIDTNMVKAQEMYSVYQQKLSEYITKYISQNYYSGISELA